MNRDEADRLLAALGNGHDRIAAALYGVDSHPALGFLRTGGLAGRTAATATALVGDVNVLWTRFSMIGDALEQARAIRGTRRPSDAEWSTLVALLTAPIVVVDPGGGAVLAPLAAPAGWATNTGARGAPASRQMHSQMSGPLGVRIRLVDLAAQVESRCSVAMKQLSEVDAAWSTASGAITPLTEAMNLVGALARDIGDPPIATPLERATTVLRDGVLADPLSAAPGGALAPAISARIASLAADIGTATTALRAQIAFRDAYPQKVSGLSARIDAVAAAELSAGAAYVRTGEKIADPGLPPVPSASNVLRSRLRELDRPFAAGDWRRVASDAATVDAAIDRALARAIELTGAADGLVARRDELRGRLAAYLAKAGELRLDEHSELAKLHAAARASLYTAPCDLPTATKAVFAYQHALTETLAAGIQSHAGHDRKDLSR